MKRLAAYAWGVMAYNLAVVSWGAYVRATGAGAGCGSHWPTCQGAVIPRAPALETIIEYTHRLTSGLALITTVILVIWAFKAAPKGHPARRGAAFSLGFMLSEAAVGAGLVLFGLVAKDTSLARGWVMSVHLINTMMLLASLALTAWWASGNADLELAGQGGLRTLLLAAVAGFLALGVSGAITALGDTLFPATSLEDGLRQDLSASAHLFLRLRMLHPFLAVAAGLLVAAAAVGAAVKRPSPATRKLSNSLVILFVFQLCAGMVNLMLLAPVWLQLVHLLLADLVWLALVLLAAAALSLKPAPAAAPQLNPS